MVMSTLDIMKMARKMVMGRWSGKTAADFVDFG
jgi:hypothetical protein